LAAATIAFCVATNGVGVVFPAGLLGHRSMHSRTICKNGRELQSMPPIGSHGASADSSPGIIMSRNALRLKRRENRDMAAM
jgi:hypothetical protein